MTVTCFVSIMISVTFLFRIDTIESDAFDASSNRGLLSGKSA